MMTNFVCPLVLIAVVGLAVQASSYPEEGEQVKDKRYGSNSFAFAKRSYGDYPTYGGRSFAFAKRAYGGDYGYGGMQGFAFAKRSVEEAPEEEKRSMQGFAKRRVSGFAKRGLNGFAKRGLSGFAKRGMSGFAKRFAFA